LPRMLDGFAEREITAVFFVVARVAQQRPQAIRELAARGHTVGSHGLEHIRFSRHEPAVLRQQLRESKSILEDITGTPCTAFRAPYFDMPRQFGPLLEDAGYNWSSSKAPFSPVAKYRHLFATGRAHKLKGSAIWEFPVPRMLGLPIPFGLSYRRLFWPFTWLSRRPPSVFYVHPYELLDDCGEVKMGRVMKALMTRRAGPWAERQLWGCLDAWANRGVNFLPPEIPGTSPEQPDQADAEPSESVAS
jgi:hypothetical protein